MQSIVEKEKNEIVDLGVTDYALNLLRDSCKGLSAATPKDYKHVVTQIAVCRTLRGKVKQRHGELKRPIIDQGKALDVESRRIIDALTDIEGPLKSTKEAVDAEKSRIKAERIQAEIDRRALILERISDIPKMSIGIIDFSSEEISVRIDRIKSLDIAPDLFAEFIHQAEQAKALAIEAATEFLDMRLAHEKKAYDEAEKLKAQALENAKVKKENEWVAAENQRIADRASTTLASRQKTIDAENTRLARENTDKEKALADQQAKIDKEIQKKKDAADLLERKKELEAMQPDIEKLQTFSDVTLRKAINEFPYIKGVELAGIAVIVVQKIDDIQEYINEELAIRRHHTDT